MIAAIYARKSTDQSGVSEEARSVTRQVEHATAYAARQGWAVAADHVYLDDGVSGAEFGERRPGFLRLMNALKPRPAFQALVMSEESRLGRESIETAYALKQLITAGVRVFFYLEDRERTLNSPMEKAMLALQTMADEMEREKARQRVSDAMLRKARAAHVTGGRCFGYRNVEQQAAGPDGRLRRVCVRRVLVPEEAAVVRRIFELCALGYGQKAIAKALNDDDAPAPRPQQGRPAGWAPSSVRAVLFRELYRGRVIYNKTRKRDGWGQAKRTTREAAAWITVEAPDLAIVSEALWTAAHRELERRRGVYLASTRGNPWGRPPSGSTAKYLLSGLARCGVCGGGIGVHTRASGKGRQYRYGCHAHWMRGSKVCANGAEVLMADADAAVLGLLERDVLRPGVVEAALDYAIAALEEPDTSAARRRALTIALAKCDGEIAHLTAAIARGGELAVLLEALRDRQARRDRLAAELEAVPAAAVRVFNRTAVRRELRRKLATWRDLITKGPAEAREVVQTALADRIVFTPGPNAHGFPAYWVRVPLALDRLFEAELPSGMASPTGFEPVFWP